VKRKTQKQKVKEYLLEGHTLTPVEAYERGWGMRLAAIINTLRGEGLNIGTNMIRNRYGTKYGQYYIKKDVVKQKKSGNQAFELLKLNNSDNPINDDESKAKLLLRMKKYDRVQFKTSLDNTRYIRIGYWEPISPNDIDYVHKNSKIRLDKISVFDDDCGYKYWYPIL
jgi:hypothetical protein